MPTPQDEERRKIYREAKESLDAVASQISVLVPRDVDSAYHVSAAIGRAVYSGIAVPKKVQTWFYSIPLLVKFMALEYARAAFIDTEQEKSIAAAATLNYYFKTNHLPDA